MPEKYSLSRPTRFKQGPGQNAPWEAKNSSLPVQTVLTIMGMATFENAPLSWFLGQLGSEMVLAQVLIRRENSGFELRHGADRTADASQLQTVQPRDARSVSQHTEAGAFRPLKSAPTLKRGWRILAQGPEDLDLALNQVYPNATADLYAAQAQSPPITDYRTFTRRQSGMYRITTMLSDQQAGAMISAACHARFCLKRRFWSVTGLEPDPVEAKSQLPCLEPCAILLEFARRVTRLEQEPKTALELGRGESETLATLLAQALEAKDLDLREGETNHPLNPRRMELLLAKMRIFSMVGPGDLPE